MPVPKTVIGAFWEVRCLRICMKIGPGVLVVGLFVAAVAILHIACFCHLRLEELQQLESQDDKDLLDEMALYIENGEEGEGLGGVALSDSKNDDDLLLQMEEFM